MRELEFLPDWYAHARRRKRTVMLQFWLTLVLIGGLGLWYALAHRNVVAREARLTQKTAELVQARGDSQRMDEQLRLKQELVSRGRINALVGAPVEMTRIMTTIEQIMPKEMSLLKLDVSTDEQVKPVTNAAGAKATMNGDPLLDRKLKVRLLAVAPTDLDLVNFLTGLNNITCFEQVQPTYSESQVDSGHAMRKFEVTFCVNLNEWSSQ